VHLGEPLFHTKMLMPDSSVQEIPVTDRYGLPCDPKFYAKPSCKRCNGRGVVSITNLTTISNGVRHTRPGPNLVRCGCVDREYERTERALLAAYPDLATTKVK